MLERVITAIGQSLARGGRTSIVKSLNTSLAMIFLGVIGLQLAGVPAWIVGMAACLLPINLLMIGVVYVFGLFTKNYDILRSEFFLLSKIAAQKQSLRGDDLKTFANMISSDFAEEPAATPTTPEAVVPGPGEVNQ